MKTKLITIFALMLLTVSAFSQRPKSTRAKRTPAKPVPAPTPLPLKMVETGYTISSGFDDHYLHTIVVLENPNPGHIGDLTAINITARDENGNVVDAARTVTSQIAPLGKHVRCDQVSLTAPAKSVEFTITKVTWLKTAAKPEAFAKFETKGVTYKRETADSFSVAGEVHNPFDWEVKSVAVAIVFRDSAGKIIGGDTTFASDNGARTWNPFFARFITVNGTPASIETYAQPGGFSDWAEVLKRKPD